MCRATGAGADPKEDPEIDRLADTHLPFERYLCCDNKSAECPIGCIHLSFHSVRQCHGLCPIDGKRQQCSPDEFRRGRS